MTENPDMTDQTSSADGTPGLPSRAPKSRDAASTVRTGDVPMERLQQVKDGMGAVDEGTAVEPG